MLFALYLNHLSKRKKFHLTTDCIFMPSSIINLFLSFLSIDGCRLHEKMYCDNLTRFLLHVNNKCFFLLCPICNKINVTLRKTFIQAYKMYNERERERDREKERVTDIERNRQKDRLIDTCTINIKYLIY